MTLWPKLINIYLVTRVYIGLISPDIYKEIPVGDMGFLININYLIYFYISLLLPQKLDKIYFLSVTDSAHYIFFDISKIYFDRLTKYQYIVSIFTSLYSGETKDIEKMYQVTKLLK